MTNKLTVGSLFSGIGGMDLGLELAGLEIKWQVEIDEACRLVLRHHWPNTPIYKDICDVGKDNLEKVDLICGGVPCQDVSVAGKRAGLAGERTGLWFEMLRVITELQPRWVLFENVPGLLSSNGGRDFATILSGLGQLGYLCAWRVFDSQWFGVAQRRRRVFLIASLGNGSAAQILFESACGCGNSPPSREQGQRTPPTTEECFAPFSHYGYKKSNITSPLQNFRQFSGDSPYITKPKCFPDPVKIVCQEAQGEEELAPCLQERMGTGGNQVPLVVNAEGSEGLPYLTSSNLARHTNNQQPLVFNFDQFTQPLEEQSTTLSGTEYKGKTMLFQHTIDGAEGQCVAMQLVGDRDNPSVSVYDEVHPTIPANPMSDRNPVVATPTLRGFGHGWQGQHNDDMAKCMLIRRLTPLECERLQGFPDNFTALGTSEQGKTIHMSDTARYRALGNAVTVTVAYWIGRNI